MNTTHLRLAAGYRILQHETAMPLTEACRLLETEQWSQYTEALWDGMQVRMIRHEIRCPYCGAQAPAYRHLCMEDPLPVHRLKRPDRAEIANWAAMQLSIFDDPIRKLPLCQPLDGAISYRCPSCGHVSEASEQLRELDVCTGDGCVWLSRPISGLRELMELRWLSAFSVGVEFPLYEVLRFDPGTHRVTIELCDAKKEPLYSQDITQMPELLHDSCFAALLRKYTALQKALAEGFLSLWPGELPFTPEELSLETFFLMTRFVGFQRSFYDALPFAGESVLVHESFAAITEQLRTVGTAICLYEASRLPQIRSLRRLFFQDPGFLFYLPECEVLYDILQDPNLMCRCLQQGSAVELLALLHDYPGIAQFFWELCGCIGAVRFCTCLAEYLYPLCTQAMMYLAMTNAGKKKELKRWKAGVKKRFEEEPYHVFSLRTEYSLPMHPVTEGVGNSTVDGHRFLWLRSQRDYKRAGCRMRNCLQDWNRLQNPVVVVLFGGETVAAIELSGCEIRQLRGFDNVSIAEDEPLYRTIQKWSGQKGLTFAVPDEEEDEELPF